MLYKRMHSILQEEKLLKQYTIYKKSAENLTGIIIELFGF